MATARIVDVQPPARPRVIVADAKPDELAWLIDAIADDAEVVTMADGRAVLEALASGAGQVVVIGRVLRDMQPSALLDALRDAADSEPDTEDAEDAAAGEPAEPATPRSPIDPRSADGSAPGLGHVPVFALEPPTSEDTRVFYVLDRKLPASDLQALVRSALAHPPSPAEPESATDAVFVQRVIEVARELAAQRDLAGASEVIVRAMTILMDADRAYCLFYDHESGALWAEEETHTYDGTAAQGLAGFAARTGKAVYATPARSDSRYCREVDDPAGTGNENLAIRPVLGSGGEVHAVFVAVRNPGSGEFGNRSRANLALLTEHTAPFFDLLSRDISAKAAMEAAQRSPLFRREAFDAYVTWQEHGDVLRVSPRWLGWTFWLLVAVFAAAAIYMVVGTVNEYSTGMAVVRMNGRTEVAATIAGTISDILVVPGQRVRKDQVLVRLHDADAVAEYRRIEEEFDAQLRNLLRAPGDVGLRQTVASLRAQKERAASLIEERLIRAAHNGTVSDVRIRQGQALGPGDILLSLIDDESDLGVIALMPGGDRPLIAPGMPMRLELSGYQYAYQNLVVDSVADEVIGPAEVNRYLGPTIGDSIELTGPVVLVRAHLPTTTFVVDDEEYRYHDGMQGLAEVRVRSRSILEHLFPELRRL